MTYKLFHIECNEMKEHTSEEYIDILEGWVKASLGHLDQHLPLDKAYPGRTRLNQFVFAEKVTE